MCPITHHSGIDHDYKYWGALTFALVSVTEAYIKMKQALRLFIIGFRHTMKLYFSEVAVKPPIRGGIAKPQYIFGIFLK
jgi:hypothetical protein